eukprot:748795-Hanusia_phi.AAC.3
MTCPRAREVSSSGKGSMKWRRFCRSSRSPLNVADDETGKCLQDVAEQKGRTIAQVAINWCMCKDTIPIPGAKSLKQAEENLGAVGWRLTTSLIARRVCLLLMLPATGEVEELDLAAKKVPRELVQVDVLCSLPLIEQNHRTSSKRGRRPQLWESRDA